MNLSFERILLPPSGFFADGNILIRHPAENGAWIWHPEKSPIETAVLRFRLRFHLNEAAAPVLHVTGDQRFQFRCDGCDVTFGPDRCDLDHWAVQSVKLQLPAGDHEFEALVWWIADPVGEVKRTGAPEHSVTPPMAQISWRGGFLAYAEETDPALLNTGTAPWTVEDLTAAVSMQRPDVVAGYIDVGPSFDFDLDAWQAHNPKPAATVMPPLQPNITGVRRPGWCLYPSDLPEQRRIAWTGGRVRAVRQEWEETPYPPEDHNTPEIREWQQLVTDGKPVLVPPQSLRTVLWDMEDYHCGYPLLHLEGGAGSVVEVKWAESLFEQSHLKNIHCNSPKGNRNVIEGKVYMGLGDRWRKGSSGAAATPALWWRSGRYIRVRVQTTDAPLTITHLGLITTGYPLDRAGDWRSSDASWDRVMPIFIRAFQAAAHETWTDTPYYEQMCYVGDTLMDALSNYTWFSDDRLSRRAIRLFEWSRYRTGWVAERYPSGWKQESPTFSLLWPTMVRDFAWWRDDAAFVRTMLLGVRSVLAEFDGFACEDGLLHKVPGWACVDWVPEWKTAYPPGALEGDSSIVNLHWVLSLQAASALEQEYGEALFARRFQDLAHKTFAAVIARYWDEKRGIFLDTNGQSFASEHAQMFALITGLLDPEKTKACLEALRKGDGLSKATIGASIYLLEALYRHGEESEFHRRLDFWRSLPDLGFTSTPESPEPTRSDAHAWGAHPVWHTLASIAGIRSDAAGFKRVRIAPLPGPMEYFEAKMVHPCGFVEVAFRRTPDGSSHFVISLPGDISGNLIFNRESRPLIPGKNEITITKK